MNVGASDMSLIFTKRVSYSKLSLYILLYSQSVNTDHFIRSLLYSPFVFEAGLFKYMSSQKSAKLCILGEASREFGMPLLKTRFFEMIRYFRKTKLILVHRKNRV